MKRSKRYTELSQKIDSKNVYPINDALQLIKDTATTKFDSSIEVHVKLGIDPKKSDQQIRASVILPHGTGKTQKIAAIVAADKEKEAKVAGADIVGDEEMIDKIKTTSKIDFDILVTTPDMMPKLAAVAKVLGPRGLMPSPKNGTITTNLKKTIDELKKGKVSFKNDDTSNVHQIIGKASFTVEQLAENLATFMDALKKVKPSASKGTFIKGASIASSMGPGVKIEVKS